MPEMSRMPKYIHDDAANKIHLDDTHRAHAIDWQRCGKMSESADTFRTFERAENTEFNKFNWRSSLGMQKFCMQFALRPNAIGTSKMNGYLTEVLTSLASLHRHRQQSAAVEKSNPRYLCRRKKQQKSERARCTHWAIQIIGGEL